MSLSQLARTPAVIYRHGLGMQLLFFEVILVDYSIEDERLLEASTREIEANTSDQSGITRGIL